MMSREKIQKLEQIGGQVEQLAKHLELFYPSEVREAIEFKLAALYREMEIVEESLTEKDNK
jgi:hypothetical protein